MSAWAWTSSTSLALSEWSSDMATGFLTACSHGASGPTALNKWRQLVILRLGLRPKRRLSRAFQHGARVPGIGWLNTAVVRDDAGRPGLRFHGLAAETAKRLGVQAALVSLSHTDLQAAAVVILVAP